MKKVIQFLFFFSFFMFSVQIFAQKKYALVIGINRYYDKPGVLHGSVLRGCVNDANAIKGMLIKRFGYQAQDITILTDEAASRKAVDNAVNAILQKIKAGDAFVFYFSGHGVWMDNINQNKLEQRLKMGMNQALVLSDLYADNLGCLYRDANVKRMFNRFVDKKVIATGIFDCCFSGQIAQLEEISMHNPYQVLTPVFSKKSMAFDEIFNSFRQNNDSLLRTQNPDWDSFFSKMVPDSVGDETKGFNLRDNLIISDPTFVVRPSERPHSRFLSLAGTNEYQKGEEMKVADGSYHGVFTKALLQTVDENPSDIPLKILFDKITSLIKQKGFQQTPVRFQDPVRLSLNLTGITPKGFSDRIKTRYITSKNNFFILDAGKTDGLATGNILSLKGDEKSVQLQIVAIGPHDATTRIIKGSPLEMKKGDQFILTNNYSKTEPLITLSLRLQLIAKSAYEKNMNERIIPLAQRDKYRSYTNWNLNEAAHCIFLNKATFDVNNITGKRILRDANSDSAFFMFLPLPEYILISFKQKLMKNGNYRLVDDPAKAQLTLYLNYVKEGNGGYVFTWAPPILKKWDSPLFYVNHIRIPKLPVTSGEITSLANKLYEMTNELSGQYTGVWINDHTKNHTTHLLQNR